jgi:hypothetical protein
MIKLTLIYHFGFFLLSLPKDLKKFVNYYLLTVPSELVSANKNIADS